MTLNQDATSNPAFLFQVSEYLDKLIFFLLIALIPLAAIPYGSVDPLPETILSSVIFFLAALWFLQGALSGKLIVKQHFVLLPCIAIIVYAVLQAIPFGQIETADASIKAVRTISLDQYETWHVVIRFTAYTFYGAMLIRYVSNESRLRWLIYTIILTAVGSALFGFYLQTTPRRGSEALFPRITDTRGFAQFINKNNFAYLMEMSAGLAAGLLIVRGIREKSSVFYAFALLIIIAGLILCFSRGGIVGLLVQTLCAGLVIAFFRYGKHYEVDNKDRNQRRITSLIKRVGIIVGLIFAVSFSVVLLGSDNLLKRIENSQSDFSVGQIEENVSRKQIWKASWMLFKENPITGVGFGGYWVGITNYDDTSGNLSLQQAHNDYLELLASGGLIGFILVVWFLFSFAKSARKNLYSENNIRRAACIGALLGCVGIAVHSIFDFGLHTPIIAIVFTTILAVAVYREDAAKDYISFSKPLKVVLAFLGIIVCLFVSYTNLKRGSGRVISETASSFSKALGNDPAAYLSLAQKAIDSAPNDPETHAAMAIVLERTGNDADAVAVYEKALSLRPRDYNLWMSLGRAREHAGEIEKAIIAFREAVNLAKPYARPKWMLGNTLLRAGQRDEALSELKKAMMRDPHLVKQVTPIAWSVFNQDTNSFLNYLNPRSYDEKLEVGKFLIEKGKNKEGLELLFASGEKGKMAREKLINEFLKENRFREAYEIWSKENNEGQVISNGSFEKDIKLNEEMFGWRIAQKTEGINVNLETKSIQDGGRALFITYKGNYGSELPVKQLVVIDPNTKYRLSFIIKTQEIVSSGMPFISVSDVMTNKEIASSKTFPANTIGWEKFEFEFTSDSKTEAVFIALSRQSCAENPCPIFGKVWLDAFELKIN